MQDNQDDSQNQTEESQSVDEAAEGQYRENKAVGESGQKGEPGLEDGEKKEWSPGSGQADS